MKDYIPFNKPFLTGKETDYIRQAIESGNISGDGVFTKKCHEVLQAKYGFQKCLLTTSCTDALEMSAILANINPGDEIIMPSYTFVSTANPFIMRGGRVIFVDSRSDHPGIDEDAIEPLITTKTKVIVVVHYAGVACDMEKIMKLAAKYNLLIVEDAAQALDNYYIYPDGTKKPLGSIGQLAAFSFHETKNIISGEGGMLVVNQKKFNDRSEIIREKGTNRTAFFRGEIDKYGWVDIGSSFLPSEIVAAFLFAQLENIDKIQKKRRLLWNRYDELFRSMDISDRFQLPFIPDYSANNAHIYYIVFRNIRERSSLIEFCKQKNIHPVFHYLSLHKSAYFSGQHDGRELPNSDHYSDCLLRLPLFCSLNETDIKRIVETIYKWTINKS